ncbi:LysR substrate-binding domain-containing protein [Rhodospirillaceae bacterium SYSU D60014]|uniref:LysR substrate-binding domain-containing protein n=1 Tax=Virgifigura deserti TaxID=2268457 RepID=UPI000E660922
MSINHAQLRAFHAVASEGSFTRAAEMLHVTQPTLSGQVKALEENYGVRLFDRRGRRVEPTELGRTLLDVTRRLFSLEAEADQLLGAARGLRRGHLRIGADAPYSIIPVVGVFNRRYPGLNLSLAIGNSDHVLQDLFDHRTDVAILANLDVDPRLFAIPFQHDRLIVFVDCKHPWARRRTVRLAELAGQRFILRELGSTTRRIFETALARAGIELGEVMEIGSREAVREAVAAGLGIGVVAQAEFGQDDRIRALQVTDADLESVEYVVCLAERQDLRIVRAFLDIVREQAAARNSAG